MKNLAILIILICGCSLKLSAQESIISEIDYATLEKYIQAAKKSPRRDVVGIKSDIAKNEVTITTLNYLEMFTAAYYYRPNDRIAIDVNNPYTINGFQFGITTSLGALLQRPFQVKKSKMDYKIAKLEAQDYDLTLVKDVKSRYYDYILQLNQVKMNSQSAMDNKNVADNLKYKFEKGEISLDVYNQSRNNLSTSSSAKILSEVNYLKAKDALEEIIGMKLEEVK
ncbi:TolC family protein [Pedobacter nyackensis]|uniref:TolC family protein n=1 Tax=Pedobacter nyackensis TaxID=475255 RepID=UPI00293155DB|nr:TolC family protein [Pedobacter nyackensis]